MKKDQIKFIVFLGCLPLILLLALEFSGRAYIWVKYGVSGKSYGIYKSDPLLGGILAENSYNTTRQFNNFAFQHRDDIVASPKDGRLRIIAYGGSTTFSYNVSMDDAWPAQLESLLRKNGFDRAEVLNAGDVMWSLGHALIRARREVPLLRPKFIMIYSGINEASNYWRLRTNKKIDLTHELANARHGLVDNDLMKSKFLYRNSVVFKIYHNWIIAKIKRLLRGARKTRQRISPPAVLENFRLILRDFVALAKSHGSQVIYVVQAMQTDLKSASEINQVRSESTLMRNSYLAQEEARNLGAIVIDAQDAIRMSGHPSRELFSTTGVHYSAKGGRVLAQYIFGQIPWEATKASQIRR